MVNSLHAYIWGPKLYMEYHKPGSGSPGSAYIPNIVESTAEQILCTFTMLRKGFCYTLPLLAFLMYKFDYKLTLDMLYFLRGYLIGVLIVFILAFFLRVTARYRSPSYNRLVCAMEMAKVPDTETEGRFLLRAFDFDFAWWPVDFSVADDLEENNQKLPAHPPRSYVRCNLCILFKLPYTIIGYMGMRSFGIHIVYPGSIHLLQRYLQPALIEGRARLVQDDFAKRFKIKTLDNNEIDMMFVDNRGYDPKSASIGNILVICCEGNVGFYEVGIMSSPLGLNYSIIGWNHPGFGGSSGRPFPDQEKSAIEGIIHFAIHSLGFCENQILLYGWSIGCFTALWGGCSYPNVKGVILDAPFDDVWPIVQQHTPGAFSNFVKIGLKDYCNLNLVDLVKSYNGPILLIRRTLDEIVATTERIDSNRGNRLLIFLLRHRYPNIFRANQICRTDEILSAPLNVNVTPKSSDEDLLMMKLIISHACCDGTNIFPMPIGNDFENDLRMKMAEFLIQKHMHDFDGGHCAPLPSEYFDVPWSIC